MATKNLARTVIEGGRAAYNRRERRHSNAVERVHARQLSRKLVTGEEFDDVVYPRRRVVYQGFHDKLAPAERWLHKQVGRSWSRVRSELFQKFDTRTTAGRHIVFDHLLREVEDTRWNLKFLVDRRGILRSVPRRRPRRVFDGLPEPHRAIEAWLAGRLVGERDSVAYWFVPTLWGSFRQHRMLTEEELKRWRSLPAWFRTKVDAWAPRPRAEIPRQPA